VARRARRLGGRDLVDPGAWRGALRFETGPPDDVLRAAAESVGAQIALFWSVRDMEARRRAMLDVAFDSVVTIDADGIVFSANRPRSGCSATARRRWSGRRSRS
jgi:hypothetical protein